MTPDEHQQRHIDLHRALDELVGCYLEEGFAAEDAGGPRPSIHDELFQLMRWAHEKTLIPSSADRHDYRRPTPQIANADVELFPWLVTAHKPAAAALCMQSPTQACAPMARTIA